MRYMRWTYPTLALLMAAACGPPDRDAYAGTPSEEEPIGTDEAETMTDTMGVFSEWDADISGALDQSEFASWWNETFVELGWETDRAEGLSEAEFYTGLVEMIDENGDGQVAQDEWQRRAMPLWGDEEPTNWADLDGDEDLTVTHEEAREGLESEDMYGSIIEKSELGDDELIDDEEIGAWFRDMFDANGDGRIDAVEWADNWFERNLNM